MDESVHVIAAFTDGRIGGIIEWNEEADSLYSSNCKQANVGEAYVYPEYRGTKLAYQLLKTAENHAYDSGARSMVSCASGCNAVTINGAVGIAIDKYRGIGLTVKQNDWQLL